MNAPLPTPEPDIFDINLAPRDEAIVYGLTRRGLCSEINLLAIAYAYALATRRHLYVDERRFVPRWSTLFDVRLKGVEDMPSRYRHVTSINSKDARANFNQMRVWAAGMAGARIHAPELDFEGSFEDLFISLANRLFQPNAAIRALAEQSLPSGKFAAVHIRRGDKIVGPELGGGKTGPEGEDHDFDVYARRLKQIDPAIGDVFLMTDDYRAFLDARGRGYEVQTLCPPEDQGYFQVEHRAKAEAERHEALSRFVAEMIIATRSSVFGGTYKSNVGRLVYALHPHKERCFSVDEWQVWRPD